MDVIQRIVSIPDTSADSLADYDQNHWHPNAFPQPAESERDQLEPKQTQIYVDTSERTEATAMIENESDRTVRTGHPAGVPIDSLDEDMDMEPNTSPPIEQQSADAPTNSQKLESAISAFNAKSELLVIAPRNVLEGDVPEQMTLDQPTESSEPESNRDAKSVSSASNQSSGTNSTATGGTTTNSGVWGWFDEGEQVEPEKEKSGLLEGVESMNDVVQVSNMNETSSMAVSAPTYVLEESLSTQRLWKDTAGNRPPQPIEERAFFEKMWAHNFAKSNVEYNMPKEVLMASSPISLSPFADGNFEDTPGSNGLSAYSVDHSGRPRTEEEMLMTRTYTHNQNTLGPHTLKHTVVNKKVKSGAGAGSGGELTVLVRGDNVFGTTVSKSFPRAGPKGVISGVDTVNISIASYRVVESKQRGKYAQYLVVYREGSFQDTVGVWKRYSAFDELARLVTHGHETCQSVLASMTPLAVTEDHDVEILPNAITSWRLLKKRQRWYRCLDAGYLSLKVFLLERFLHDILFESSSPKILRDFVGVDASLYAETKSMK